MADQAPNPVLVWVVGFLSVLFISLMALIGAAMVPIFRKNKKAENRFFHIFVALAVATLTADAMLHMVPEILDIHTHKGGGKDDHSGHDHGATSKAVGGNASSAALAQDSHEEADPHAGHDHDRRFRFRRAVQAITTHDKEEAKYRRALIHMSVVLLSIWAFYVLETVSTCIAEAKDLKETEVGESPYGAVSTVDSATTRKVHLPGGEVGDIPLSDLEKTRARAMDRQFSKMSVTTRRRETVICFGLRPIAMMILVGDAIHNFADGMAIGAAMTDSIPFGLSTSLAILFHELPHELGDFVVLLNSGLSVKKALLLNFVSALTAFAGLCVGIPIGNIDGARPWLFSLAAGMFLYVALVDMMHHMREMERHDPWWLTMVWQNVGLFAGFGVIFVIGFFEDQIRHI